MNLEVTGKIHSIGEVEQKTESFQAREFVLEVMDGQYPQLAKFQLVQERCGIIESHNVGDTVTVHFDLRGREWNGRVLTNLNAWKVVGDNSPAPRPVPPPDGERYAFPDNNGARDAEGDDLPF